jgi:autotransporter-associated beta strand protein
MRRFDADVIFKNHLMQIVRLLSSYTPKRQMFMRNSSDVFIGFVAAILLLLSATAQATVRYWDTDGVNPGLGIGGPYDWVSDDLWNTDPTGGGAGVTGGWMNGDSAVFNGNGTSIVTVDTPVTCTNFYVGDNIGAGTNVVLDLTTGLVNCVNGIYVGYSGSGGATVDLTGNSILACSNWASPYPVQSVGSGGCPGTLNISNNSMFADCILDIGNSAGAGTVNVNGGELYSWGNAVIGNSANGTVNINGNGSFVGNNVTICNAANINGTVNLNGGTMTAGIIYKTSSGANGTATFNFNGGTLIAAGSHAPDMFGLDAVVVKSGGAIINTAGYSITFSNALTDGGGGGGLTKNGLGTLILLGTNTYTGATLINAGTITLGAGAVNASILGNTPEISIAGGATFNVSAAGFTFTGSGTPQTLSGTTTSGAATIAAGTGSQGVTLAAGALASFEAAGGGSSTVGKISVTGDLNLNGNAITVTVTGASLVPGTYRLMDCTGTLSGSANAPVTIAGTALAIGSSAVISTTPGSAGHVDLVVSSTLATFSNLSPSQTIIYGAANLTLNGTVSASGTMYPANGETVTVMINGNAQTTTISGSQGSFSINYNPSTIPVSATPYPITYLYQGDGTLNSATDSTTTLTVISQAQAGPSWLPKYVGTIVNGQVAPCGYYEYLPASYNANSLSNYPVVIFMHGSGQYGDGTATGSPGLANILTDGLCLFIQNNDDPVEQSGGVFDLNNVIVLCPQCTVPYPMSDATFRSFYNFALAAYPHIDKRRIWFTGLSYGSTTVTTALDYTQDPSPDDPAAVLACAWRGDDLDSPVLVPPIADIGKVVPLWVLTSQSDTSSDPDACVNALATAISGNNNLPSDISVFPSGYFTNTYTAYFNGGSWILSAQQMDPITSVNPKMTYFISAVGHDSWGLTYLTTNTWSWLFQQVKPTVAITSPATNMVSAQGSSLTFTGVASDKNGTALTGSSLVWIDSVNGTLGTGNSITVSNLSIGAHIVKLQATDNSYRDNKTTVNVTVPYSGPFTAWFDFGPTGLDTSNWNDVSSTSVSTITNAVNTNGMPVGLNLEITSPFVGTENGGVPAANLYPLTAQEDTLYVGGVGVAQTAQLLVNGLNPAKIYNFQFFASRNVTDDRTSTYTINGSTVSLQAAGNTTNTVSLYGMTPNASGQMIITIGHGGSATYGYLGVMAVTTGGAVDAKFTPGAFANVNYSQVNNGIITFSATNGVPNGGYALLMSTNITLPFSQWTAVATGQFDGDGNLNGLSITNASAFSQRYFVIRQ